MTRPRPLLLVAVVALVLSACSLTTLEASGRLTADNCVVRVHGRAQSGDATTRRADGVAELAPTGNASSEFGKEWRYGDDESYLQARDIVAERIAGAQCHRVVLNGHSNGGAFVATLLCRGETFDGTLVGVVIDDPVPDTATQGCQQPDGVDVALYWTGALEPHTAVGTRCDTVDLPCAGEVMIGIEAMAANVGAPILDSIHRSHRWYRDAPQIDAWLLG